MLNPLRLSLAATILALAISACGSSSSGTSSSSTSAASSTRTSGSANSVVVKTASNPTYGTILVTGQGATLYHLSGEAGGKFICTTSACLAAWHPLTVPSADKSGREVDGLGTVTRPEGSVQVAYHGTPLYTFAADQHAGEAKGEGFKDVGTWTVVTVASPAAKTSTSTTPTTPASSGGGGSGY